MRARGMGATVCGAGRETLSCKQSGGGGRNRGVGVVCKEEGRGTATYVWRVEGTPLISAVIIAPSAAVHTHQILSALR